MLAHSLHDAYAVVVCEYGMDISYSSVVGILQPSVHWDMMPGFMVRFPKRAWAAKGTAVAGSHDREGSST